MTDAVLAHSERAHAVLAPSASSRWVACTGSVSLSEKMKKIAPEESSKYAEEGTLAHEVAEIEVERMLKGSSDHDFKKDVTPEMIEHGKAYAQYIQDESMLADKVFIEQKLDMSEAIPGCWGTVDCLIIEMGGTLHIIDYKYGTGVKVKANINYQLICYAIGAFLKYDPDYMFEKIKMTVYQPRLEWVDSWETTPENLKEYILIMAKAAKKALAGSDRFSEGSHCRFCQAKPVCPEKLKKVQQAIVQSSKEAEAPVPEALHQFLYVADIVEEWIKSVKDTALRAAKNGNVPKDHKLVEGRRSRKWIDEQAVIDEFDLDLGDELYKKTVLTPAQLQKIVGKEQIEPFVETKQGNLALVHASDPRKAYKTEAELVFDEIE